MIAASLFDNWAFFLLILVAMLFRWLMSVANKASQNRDDSEDEVAPPLPMERPPAQSDEERIRKFLEALGQPAGSRPPPRVERRQMDVERAAREARARVEQVKRAVEQRKRVFVPGNLPPVPTTPPPLPVETPPPPAQVTIEEGPPPERMAALKSTKFEVHEIAPAQSGAPRPASAAQLTLAAMLRSRQGLRNAVILREVFGPPRSLQPLDEVRV